jgi:hypothetical protein
MADTKISALTASTTPLAGTEVLPIVQSGVTKQVSVANLTAGRAISATQMTLTTGNLIVASGQGIDFSATSGAGTSELLNDYEEGTWTPVATSSGSGFTATTVSATGNYTKVGNQVFVTANMVLNITVAGTGTPRITGLPFSASVTSGVIPGIYLAFLTVGNVSYVSTNVINFEGNTWNPSGTNRSLTFNAVYNV